MQLEVNGRQIEANAQGYLLHPEEWNEEVCKEIAAQDNIELFVDHWELIWYVREYYEEKQTCPTMHTMIKDLAPKKSERFSTAKEYEKHIYSLFPRDACHQVCKLAGIPMPPPDT
ncbi:MAG: TusE/DsrC/DsvC family sulfur relay protein [bacterium]